MGRSRGRKNSKRGVSPIPPQILISRSTENEELSTPGNAEQQTVSASNSDSNSDSDSYSISESRKTLSPTRSGKTLSPTRSRHRSTNRSRSVSREQSPRGFSPNRYQVKEGSSSLHTRTNSDTLHNNSFQFEHIANSGVYTRANYNNTDNPFSTSERTRSKTVNYHQQPLKRYSIFSTDYQNSENILDSEINDKTNDAKYTRNFLRLKRNSVDGSTNRHSATFSHNNHSVHDNESFLSAIASNTSNITSKSATVNKLRHSLHIPTLDAHASKDPPARNRMGNLSIYVPSSTTNLESDGASHQSMVSPASPFSSKSFGHSKNLSAGSLNLGSDIKNDEIADGLNVALGYFEGDKKGRWMPLDKSETEKFSAPNQLKRVKSLEIGSSPAIFVQDENNNEIHSLHTALSPNDIPLQHLNFKNKSADEINITRSHSPYLSSSSSQVAENRSDSSIFNQYQYNDTNQNKFPINESESGAAGLLKPTSLRQKITAVSPGAHFSKVFKNFSANLNIKEDNPLDSDDSDSDSDSDPDEMDVEIDPQDIQHGYQSDSDYDGALSSLRSNVFRNDASSVNSISQVMEGENMERQNIDSVLTTSDVSTNMTQNQNHMKNQNILNPADITANDLDSLPHKHSTNSFNTMNTDNSSAIYLDAQSMAVRSEKSRKTFYSAQEDINPSSETLRQTTSNAYSQTQTAYSQSYATDNNNYNPELASISTGSRKSPSIQLYGKSLKIFPPHSKFRRICAKYAQSSMMNQLMALAMLVQVGALTHQHSSVERGYVYNGGYTAVDWLLFVIYIFYTTEGVMQCIAFGIYDDSQAFKALNIQHENFLFWKAYYNRLSNFGNLLTQSLGFKKKKEELNPDMEASITNSMGQTQIPTPKPLDFTDSAPATKPNLPHTVTVQNIKNKPKFIRAYLRSGWHRLDFISITCFWISFFLSFERTDVKYGLLVFRSLMCLKILRLLNVTSGTRGIMKSLRRVAYDISDVAVLLLCFWLFFAIIGVQSFKTSLTRHCVWINPDNPADSYEQEFQFCGSFYDQLKNISVPYLYANGESSSEVKGYTCPKYSQCMITNNPYAGTISFDNILNSLELVFVVISANTFTDIMYYTLDSDAMAASLFFIFSILVLTVWMLSLGIAVIISSYNANIEVMKKLSRKKIKDSKKKSKLFWAHMNEERHAIYEETVSKIKLYGYYLKVERLFVSVILTGFIFQATRTSRSSPDHINSIYIAEVVVSLILLVEIIYRFCVFLPKNWKVFFYSYPNILDLIFAVISSIILIPQIYEDHNSVYRWLCFFQIARFYRVVFLFDTIKNSWLGVLRYSKPFFDLCVFFVLVIYLIGLIVSRMFEGLIPSDEFDDIPLSMQNLPNVMLSLYTISSTENWTDVLYESQKYTVNAFQCICVAVYLILWFMFSNMVILNIFIAIITRNLSVPELKKKQMQIKQFYEKLVKSLTIDHSEGVIDAFRARIGKKVDRNQLTTEQIIEQLKTLSTSPLLEDEEDNEKDIGSTILASFNIVNSKIFLFMEKRGILPVFTDQVRFKHRFFKIIDEYSDPKTFLTASSEKNDSVESDESKSSSEDYGTSTNSDTKEGSSNRRNNLKFSNVEEITKQSVDSSDQEEDDVNPVTEFLRENPSFNTSMYLFPPNHRLRILCQKVVPPPVGRRFEGHEPIPLVKDLFQACMFTISVVVVILASYTTPLFRKEHGFYYDPWNWGTIVDLAFTLVFTVEFLIKAIADGLLLTPNPYFNSPWNTIDFVVLISFWITFMAEINQDTLLVRVVGELRAMRALRLLTITSKSKEAFHIAVISGARQMINAAVISLSLLLPFSLWGLVLFSGKLGVCSDGESPNADCILEYSSTVFKWDIISPNAVIQPYLEFNSFRRAIYSLFQIISLEGWVDLLLNLMNITDIGMPPETFASPGNGLFLIAFNFVGIVFILNLFVSIIISNYSKQTGVAYLTEKQLAWYDVKKVLGQIRASKRKNIDDLSPFRLRCYKMVVEKNPYRSFALNFFLLIHIAGLVSECYPTTDAGTSLRYVLFVISTAGLLIFNLLLMYALGIKLFLRNRWNIFRLFVISGAFILSVISYVVSRGTTYANINKLFLVAVLIFLIPRNDRLSQLLKYASASLPSLASLIYTWIVLFLVFAIALNQIFGLTRTGPNTSGNINCRTVTKTLILLFRASFGEGWNYIMDDFTLSSPYCTYDPLRQNSDCGNMPLATILFVVWNILSMYIFLNILVSVVVNSFGYVKYGSGPRSLLTREEIRKFKKAWTKFDESGSGYINADDLHPFLRSLNGILSYNVYGESHTIKEITKTWITKRSDDPYDIDYDLCALSNTFSNIDFMKVKERRRRFNRLLCEAQLSVIETRTGPKIPFTDLILQVGFYSRFDDSTCLTLEDFIKRYVIIQRINKYLKKQQIIATIQMVLVRLRYILNKHRDFEFDKEIVANTANIYEVYDNANTTGDGNDNNYNNNNNADDYNRENTDSPNGPFNDDMTYDNRSEFNVLENRSLYRSVSKTNSINPFSDYNNENNTPNEDKYNSFDFENVDFRKR
ncbi:hypothetical protein B5S32_g4356 [[Candida] boidinii]|nr:hypothetical protein B5S32_g4356 [[Candida] boidinii]